MTETDNKGASRCFNPRPPLLAGELTGRHGAQLALPVSIRARHCWRANWGQPIHLPKLQGVSIRARHCWRANVLGGVWAARTTWFQSAPAIAGGRTVILPWQCGQTWCFNPRPPLLAGELYWRCYWSRRRTGFNPRPPLLAGELLRQPGGYWVFSVSIRARHCWRANSRGAARPGHCSGGFNPRPPLLAGELKAPCAATVSAGCFNPRPPLLAGELRYGGGRRAGKLVSIRARHCWRANYPHILP
ncbi:hypothetical protein BLL52_1453 [Rhodoferax antarcticus ANT.BR]|uniref:Uncharacterized protein n=1 Tax=Rhodoferax antarcticus ANT.BR TaxID=1111071 RepID=A0A1Q8YGP9_9BURK|nr:hypothetical protein BLL52_1453 [Rhodoferax antarcticus ANT.BR]